MYLVEYHKNCYVNIEQITTLVSNANETKFWVAGESDECGYTVCEKYLEGFKEAINDDVHLTSVWI